MRLSYVLLLAAAVVLAGADALSTEGGAEARFLRAHRTHKKAASATAADEERSFLGLFAKAPEELPMFERMALQPSFMNHIFESWRTGMATVEGAVAFMKLQKLTPEEIEKWTGLFIKHLADHKKAVKLAAKAAAAKAAAAKAARAAAQAK